MATGMQMLLSSFGLDPEKIKTDVAKFGQIIVDMDKRQARLEAMIENLIAGTNRLANELATLNTQLSGEPPRKGVNDDTGTSRIESQD